MKKPENINEIEPEIDSQDNLEISITLDDINLYSRLDKFLSDNLAGHSRTSIKNLFERGMISAQNSKGKSEKIELKKMPRNEVTIQVTLPPPLPTSAKAENLPLKILFEDEHLLIVNKSAGMVTHPAPGNYNGTLVNAVLHHCPDIGMIGDQKRPGIVHRLDKGTSGVMVVAKNQKTHEGLVSLFSSHDIDREYQCIAMSSKIRPSGTLQSIIGRDPNNRKKMAAKVQNGKEAITHYKVEEVFDVCSHLKVTLETGRTHQIRVHLCSLLKAPILNDSTYGNPTQDLKRMDNKFSPLLKEYDYAFLHARKLGFVHPMTKEHLTFVAEPPHEFQAVLKMLREENDTADLF